ncbi:hypothetical protein [Polaribacter sp. IC073]|uniref:hypothetical protein n=1 Tax=Polaribacter sp. IC073 TaxID=2508540 RepID=UPI0011BF4312|nr:hypothetical protein [Polaribacter sp. IC073]TXD46043.1 hypothetical protein ES045_15185 [Polaribacter sp. IC073]
MKNEIIEAIKNFDIARLNVLLDDDTSYMDVTKFRFLNRLEKKFNTARKEGCCHFDEIFFGICGDCNKGCEGLTFLSTSGYYLDLLIKSKDEKFVDDIYTCSKIIGSNIIEKKYSLEPHFYEDEKVSFQPYSDYKFVEEQYKLMITDIDSFKEDLSFEDFIAWYETYGDLRNLNFLETTILKLYTKIYDDVNAINKILEKEIETENFVRSIKEAVSV